MTAAQWWRHACQWARSVRRFPWPWRTEHHWTSVVGEKRQWCIGCDLERDDPEYDEAEAAAERARWAPIEELLEGLHDEELP